MGEAFVSEGGMPDAELEPAPLLDLAVLYQVDRLASASAKDMLIGITADNVRERARTLKRHADHPALPDVWPRFREILKSKDEFLDALAV